jgi:hypothetical protein
VNERTLTAELFREAMGKQLLAHHCPDARRCWGPGFPDLFVAGLDGAEAWELKSAFGTRRSAQTQWRYTLEAAGLTVRLVRPANFLSGQTGAWLDRLALRS